MNRILRGQQETVEKIYRLEDELQDAERADDKDTAMALERQIATLRASQETMSRDFKDLQARKSALYKDLKGTREQRIKAIEDHRQTFPTLITKVMTDPKYRQDMATYIEKMRLATEKERARLSELISYEDNIPDRPLLNSDSTMKDE
jgi:acetolactate synthase small subunit